MFFIALGIFIFKFQTSQCQYPNHMDFQKVGETIFNNEKYNILKPTTHVISDYFKEFMLRRDNANFPTKRVFIDRNGFRHYWSGFGSIKKSLRKTDDIDANLIANTENRRSIKFEKQLFSEDDIKKALRTGNDTETEAAEETTTTETPAVTEAPGETTTASNNETTTIVEDSSITANDTETTTLGESEIETTTTPKPKPEGERVVAKTTFFCPYFGVITMAAFID